MLQRRRDVPPDELDRASAAVVAHALPLLPHGATVALYAPHGGEPDVRAIPDLRPDLRVAWPRVTSSQGAMVFVTAPASSLVRGFAGILEPPDGEIVAPRDFDAMLIPGTAFSAVGARLGMGGGFYDRYLEQLRDDALRVGIAHHWQLVPTVPEQHHDRRMTHVVTDSDVWHTATS